MIKTIMIEDQPIEINSSLGWLFCYREQFGHDILPDLLPLVDAALNALSELYDAQTDIIAKLDEESISKIIVSLSTLEMLTIINICWAMAKNAGETKNPTEWINSFDVFPFDVVVPEIFIAIIKSSASSKNSESLLQKIPFLSTLTQSQSQAQAED